MTDTEIETFLRAFEDGSLPGSEWTHARHLVMALWYVRRLGRVEATGVVRDGIRRYNLRRGKPTGYHETITLAWLDVVDRFLSERDRTRPMSALVEELLAECGHKDYLLRFYTPERLFSDEARSRWLPPDLADIGPPRRREGIAPPSPTRSVRG